MHKTSSALFPLMVLLALFMHANATADSIDTTTTTHNGRIHGHIVDAHDSEFLIGAHVYIPALSRGTTTDERGYYELRNLPVGSIRISVSHIGYQGEQRSIIVYPDETTIADFRLIPGIHELGTVVVTGTQTPYLYTESPVKTEVITRALINSTQSLNLAEALSLQTGVAVENSCQNCNFTQVRILGFEGKYSQVLIDGDPVVSSLAAVYALEHFPEEMIEQIEVVKGGGSALYGGGAIAGTINVRTRYPLTNRSRANYIASSINGVLDHKAGAFSELRSGNTDMGAYLYFSARHRNPYDHNDDGFTELGEIRNRTLGAHWYYNPLERGELQIALHHISEERRGGSDFDRLLHEARVTEWTEHDRWGGKLRWKQHITPSWHFCTHYSFSILGRNSYYGGLTGDTAEDIIAAFDKYGTTKNRTHVGGMQSTLSTGVHDITIGAQYSGDILQDKSVSNTEYHVNTTYSNLGIYAQDAVTLFNNRIILVAGARMDRHSELDNPILSPRINARMGLTSDLNLRVAFTTGFKAPQIFDEDLHIEALGGVQRVVRNIEGLKAEQSRSFSSSLDYNSVLASMPVLAGITVFHTQLLNAFTNVERSMPDDDIILWQRINSDGGYVQGLEIDLGIKPSARMEIRGGATYKIGRYNTAQEIFDGIFSDHFLRTPDVSGYIRASHNINDKLSLFSALRYTGVMTLPDEAAQQIVHTTDTFLEIDFGATFNISLARHFSLNLNTGVKNLSNAYQKDLQIGIDRDPSYLYGPSLPRRFYLGMDILF